MAEAAFADDVAQKREGVVVSKKPVLVKTPDGMAVAMQTLRTAKVKEGAKKAVEEPEVYTKQGQIVGAELSHTHFGAAERQVRITRDRAKDNTAFTNEDMVPINDILNKFSGAK